MAGANDRRVDILRAIVTDYVATGEPVGSKTLVERHDLGVSPATVRNDMSVLEELGYLYQPHTSAGRIPTEKGYRAFVDQISAVQPLSLSQRRAMESFLMEAVDFDDVVDRTVRVLAQLTRQLAVVQYPRVLQRGLRHLELITMGPHSLLVVIITDRGTVEQRTIESVLSLPELGVDTLAAQLNAHFAGIEAHQMTAQANLLQSGIAPSLRPLFNQVVTLVKEVLTSEKGERIVMAGAGNLVRHEMEFNRNIGAILDALEEQVTLLQLFSQMDQVSANVAVKIGSEHGNSMLEDAAVVAGSYSANEVSRAHIGVVGPTRMDYPGAMSAVRAVSRYLSRFLNQQAGS